MFSFLQKPKAIITLQDNAIGNHEFVLKENSIEIGRNKSPFSKKLIEKIGSKITIAGNDMTKRISTEHGTFLWDKTKYKYTYQEHSEKGTLVDGEPLEHGEQKLLESGSEIVIHPFKFKINYP